MKIVRDLLLIFFAIVQTMTIAGCSSDEDNGDHLENQTSWYEVQSEATYTSDEMAKQIATSTTESRALATTYNANVIYKSVIMNYKSVDAIGKPIILSGRLILLTSSKEADAPLLTPTDIVMYNHYTICADYECPSRRMPVEAVMAAKNMMVVCPDYIGYGVTKAQPHPFLCADLTARNCTDMAKAALQYLKDKGTSMASGYGVYNVGYSQGGAVTLGVHKYIEQNASLNAILPLKATRCGDGPYDMLSTLSTFLTEDKNDMPVIFPMVVIGMKAGHPDIMQGVEVKDFFSAKCIEAGILEMVADKNMTTREITAKIIEAMGGSNIRDIMSADAQDQNSRIRKALDKAMEANNLTVNWKPKHPVVFYHSKADKIVPFLNMERAVSGIGNNNVYWTTQDNMGHVEYGVYFMFLEMSGKMQNTDFSSLHKAAELKTESQTK